MRTLIDIPEEDLKLLTQVAKKLSVSRAEFMRQVVATSLAPHRQKMNHAAFGAWSDSSVITSKPAIRYHFKTGQRNRPKT
jgi:hypothetical protein